MGRKKTGRIKSIQIRITPRVRYELHRLKEEMQMPTRYTEGDVIEALLRTLQTQAQLNLPTY